MNSGITAANGTIENPVILEMKGIDKRFQGVHALKKSHLELRKGEIHALVGENGAGKSTMMKVLTGIYQADEGEIIYNGEKVHFKNPKDAQTAGIAIVHQELNLMNHLTAAQNIFIGREGNSFFVTDDEINVKTRRLFERFKMKIDSTEKVGNLTVGKQQMVEIVKAISFDAKILILDEPTAALTKSEIVELFDVMNDLKAHGVTMIYISHRMDEIQTISDRITIMRDGEYVKTLVTKETNLDEIIKAMVGRIIYIEPKTGSNIPDSAPVVLEVRGLTSRDVHDVSFDLRKGEILGFAGLMGAGRTETARLIFGADPIDSGEIYKDGKKLKIKAPVDAVRAGIGYLSEDRKRFGLAVDLSVSDNTVLADLENFTRKGFIDDRKVRETCETYVQKINIKTPSISQLIRNLSGGNQQKVIVAKWIVRNCSMEKNVRSRYCC